MQLTSSNGGESSSPQGPPQMHASMGSTAQPNSFRLADTRFFSEIFLGQVKPMLHWIRDFNVQQRCSICCLQFRPSRKCSIARVQLRQGPRHAIDATPPIHGSLKPVGLTSVYLCSEHFQRIVPWCTKFKGLGRRFLRCVFDMWSYVWNQESGIVPPVCFVVLDVPKVTLYRAVL